MWLPGGGWRAEWADSSRSIGFEDPTGRASPGRRSGRARAAPDAGSSKATPKDKYYLYGKIQLYVDRETYQGAWNRKFGWNGELLNTYYVLGFQTHKFTRPDGSVEWLWGSNMGYQMAENIKMNRATVSGQLAPGKDPANDRRVHYDPSFFDFTTLQRFGK